MDFEITESSFPGATHLLLGVFRKLFYSWKLVQRFALCSGELSFASFQKTFHLNNITFSDSNALDRIFAGANTSTLIHTNMGIWASVHLINHPLKVAFFFDLYYLSSEMLHACWWLYQVHVSCVLSTWFQMPFGWYPPSTNSNDLL